MASGVRLVRECRWWQRWLVLFLQQSLFGGTHRKRNAESASQRDSCVVGRAEYVGWRVSGACACQSMSRARGEEGDDGDDNGARSLLQSDL